MREERESAEWRRSDGTAAAASPRAVVLRLASALDVSFTGDEAAQLGDGEESEAFSCCSMAHSVLFNFSSSLGELGCIGK